MSAISAFRGIASDQKKISSVTDIRYSWIENWGL